MIPASCPCPQSRAARLRRASVAAWVAAASIAAPPAAAEDGDAFRFGPYRTTIERLSDPAAVAVDADDRILVLESGRGRVSTFTADGTPGLAFGASGSGRGELTAPRGLALGPDGTVFVADTGNHRVQVFGSDGTFLRAWGGYGSNEGSFNEPAGIAVAGDRVLVADLGNHRVQVFGLDGTPIAAIGGHGSEDGSFNRPVGLAVDDASRLYVSDADNNRIQMFTADGRHLASWGDWGPFIGLLDQPGGLRWRDGSLYIADTRNHRIQIFGDEGRRRDQWGTHARLPHEGDGALHYPNDLAIAPSGAFAVVCEAFEHRCQVFDALPPGSPVEDPPPPPRRKQAHFGQRLATDGKLLTIAEPENHRVYIFEMSKDIPIVIGEFGERGPRFGQVIRVGGLELDLDRRTLLMTDLATRRLQTFRIDYDPDGPRAFSSRRARLGRAYDLTSIPHTTNVILGPWVVEPVAMRRAASGHLFMVDARSSRVLVIDPDRTVIGAWGHYGTGPGELRSPSDLALSADGTTVYVVDSGNHRVQAFDLRGELRHVWGEAGEGDGQFLRPFGIAAGRDGSVYVTDVAAHRISKFTADGKFLTGWGGLGTEHGEFWSPTGIVEDERGRLIVIDTGNHRAQIFDASGDWLVTFGTGRAYTKWDATPGKDGT